MSLETLHPPVVHFPIALLLLGSAAALLDLAGVRRAELRVLAWWPLRLGWLGAGAAVLTGLLAQSGLPPRPPYSTALNWHIGSGLTILLVYGTLLYRQWLWSAKRRRRGPAPDDLLDAPGARVWVIALLVLGMALVALSGWLGGELVYTWGVNVAE
ncbi:MAG: DUF2231 domain-containing protein [Caldilineaceae bacterium]|nr:DUF2231 domain-containing protein [Caldilineaceae bacterium]